MKTLVVIPARYNSTRLPGKPLIDMKGKPMIQRVYEQCLKSEADTVIVATDSEEVFHVVADFGGICYMTSDCESGTERVIETALNGLWRHDIVINVQGDEPFIDPEDINLVIENVSLKPEKITTLLTHLKESEYTDRNVVKCLNQYREAAIFTRSPVYDSIFKKHIGIYGFSIEMIETISKLTVKTTNEEAESLEQLRWLDNGLRIRVAFTENDSIGIDTPSDLEQALLKL